MSEVQRFRFEEDGEVYDIYIETTSTPEMVGSSDDEDDPGGMGFIEDVTVQMRQAQSMIRGYTLYALNAFKGLTGANVEEIKLNFGLKVSARTGIPYITEGKADCNLEISVTCTFPGKAN